MYTFTKDWFGWAPPVWEQIVPMLPDRKSFLEIGSFEGRSAVWIAENMMEDGGHLVCIDTWEGGEEHHQENMGEVEQLFDQNMALLASTYPSRHIEKVKDTSISALSKLIPEVKGKYSFIYIDGSHIAKDVLTDACMAWELLSVGGIMVFDDYLWGDPRIPMHKPKIAVDAFTNIFGEHLAIVHLGYQFIVRKLS